MAIGSILAPTPLPLFGFNIPAWVVPFLSMAVIQLFVPNASFIVSGAGGGLRAGGRERGKAGTRGE